MSSEVLSNDTDNPLRGLATGGGAATPREMSLLDELRRSIAASQRDLHRAQRQLSEAHADVEWWTRRLAGDSLGAPEGIDAVRDGTEFRQLSARLCAREPTGCRILHGERTDRLPHEHPVPHSGGAGHRSVVARIRLEEPDYRHAVERGVRSGHRCRVLPTLATTVQLADGVALLSLRQPVGSRGLLLRRPELVELAAQHFEATWSRALPVDARRPEGPDQPSEVQLQILRLAAVGTKDDSIARSLGRSTRWVRRHFEVLEEQLGATNRMTLGIAAVRRGWI